jgi:hypothetical protein
MLPVMDIITVCKLILFSLILIVHYLNIKKSNVHKGILNFSNIIPSSMWRSSDAQESSRGGGKMKVRSPLEIFHDTITLLPSHTSRRLTILKCPNPIGNITYCQDAHTRGSNGDRGNL